MSNKSKIYIVDFEDSFTFNIANILYPFCSDLQVVHYSEFFEDYFQQVLLEKYIAVILGPGPGHPKQYSKYFSQIAFLLNQKNIYVMGICLGHQLIALQLGHAIVPSHPPMHGESIGLNWNNVEYNVQRYNSLAVSSLNLKNEVIFETEVMILDYENGRSYQFHPESIGTVNSIVFFTELLSFIGLV